GNVAGRDDARKRQLRHEADLHRTRSAEIRPERAAEQHLRDLLWLDAEIAAENAPAGRDRGLRELELADVALREVDLIGEVEDVLLADLAKPFRGIEHEAARVVEDARAHELRDRVDETGAAKAHGGDVADHRQLDVAVDDLHALDRAVGRAHAAADLRRLERGPGGRGR